MNLFTKQKQTYRHPKQTYSYQRGNEVGGINQELGMSVYTLAYVHACSVTSVVSDSVTPWTVGQQASLSMGFSRQEYWSVLHALLQGIFLTQGLNLHLLCLPHWQQVLYHQHHKCTTSHSLPDCLRLFHISAEV